MVEEINYQVLKKDRSIEIRQYPQIILAEVKGQDDTNAFNILYHYITGNNTTQKNISMTAPVITSLNIEMTHPVISQGPSFAFVLPQKYNEKTTPKPNSPEISIRVEPEKTIAVLRFSGRTIRRRIQTFEQELQKQLKDLNLPIKGKPFLMRYNSPFTPGFLRRNEIGVEVHYE
jgi:hypothetical protein